MVAVIALVQRGMALRKWRHTIGTVRELSFCPSFNAITRPADGWLYLPIRFADCEIWYRAEQPVLTTDHGPVMVGVHA